MTVHNGGQMELRRFLACSLGIICGGTALFVTDYVLWRYIFAIVIFSIVFNIALFLLCKADRANGVGHRLLGQCLPLLLFGVAVIFFLQLDIYDGSGIMKGTYYISRLLGGAPAVLCILIGLGGWFAYRKYGNKKLDVLVALLGEGIIIVLSKMWYIKYIAAYDIHYDAYFYPVYRIASGDTCYVDFTSIYGTYGYFLAPFVRSTGLQAVTEFSAIMCVLVFVCFSLIFYMLFQICKNKILALLGMLATVYWPSVFLIEQQGYSYYLQYVPHRMLFPCIIMALFVRRFYYRANKTQKVVFARGGTFVLINSLAAFWNLETGLICVIATMLLLILEDFLYLGYGRWYTYVPRHLLEALSAVALSLVLLEAITYIRAGVMVDITELFSAASYFTGGGMLELKHSFGEIQRVCCVILIIFIAPTLAYIFSKWQGREKDQDAKAILVPALFTVMLLGQLTYPLFKRNHPYNSTLIIYLIVIIIVLWLNRYEEQCTGSTTDTIIKIGSGLKCTFGILCISLMAGTMLTSLPKTDELCYANVDVWLPETLGFIEDNIGADRDIELMMINSSYMYCMLDVPDTGHIAACVDWLEGQYEMADTLQILQNTDKTVVIDKYALSLICSFDNGVYGKPFERLMKERFEEPIISENENLRIYKPLRKAE